MRVDLGPKERLYPFAGRTYREIMALHRFEGGGEGCHGAQV